MPTFRITIMLKSGVLDAPGQAVERGLRALSYGVERVRVGKVVELTVPEPMRPKIGEMCERFLANPLIETWRIDETPTTGPAAAGAIGGWEVTS
jgi:phosphoribosylformylglycinamidine synthase